MTFLKNIFCFLIILSFSIRGFTSPNLHLFEKNHCQYQKDYKFLTDKEKSLLEGKLDSKLNSHTLRKIKVFCDDKESVAYILNGKIRTHYQTLLIWVDQHKLKGLEILEFHEPKKYQAPSVWMKRIYGKDKDSLYGVDALSGATLTRQSTLKLIKQALSIK